MNGRPPRDHHQHNSPSDSGVVYAVQGGVQNIYATEQRDHLADAQAALHRRLYPQALRRFEEFLVTADQDRTAGRGGDTNPEMIAAAHLGVAVSILGRNPPANKAPEDIGRVDTHLDLAIRNAPATMAGHVARVLWAVVKDDYYDADGTMAPPPSAAELRPSVTVLEPSAIAYLVTHLCPARGPTWAWLAHRAGELGIAVDTVRATVRRGVDPARREAVTKYFVLTPPEQAPTPWVLALVGGTALVVTGLLVGGVALLLLLVAGGFSLYRGVESLIDYRRYLRIRSTAEPKPGDRQMDAWLREDVGELIDVGAARLRLNIRPTALGGDLVFPPQIVVGIPEPDEDNGLRIRTARGRDGFVRSSIYDVLILFLTDGLLAGYGALLDSRTGEVIYDHADEYHYRDIVGVSSSSIPLSADAAKKLGLADGLTASLWNVFSLAIVNGHDVSVNIGYRGPTIDSQGSVAWPNGEALAIVQKMVRARKQPRRN